jgi:hypothetical protein
MPGRNTGDSITERAVGAYSRIADPRLREIVTALIKHLHALVKEVRLTRPKWEFAWDFMARMAAVTGPERNEFLLLADVIGLSQLIEVIDHDRPDSAGRLRPRGLLPPRGGRRSISSGPFMGLSAVYDKLARASLRLRAG